MRVESEFQNVQNWEFYAVQTEEENPAGADAIALEVRGSRNLLFANTYMYRVSRNVLPKTYAVSVGDSDQIAFRNVKVFSQTRLAFDNAVRKESSGVMVRSTFFTTFNVNRTMASPSPLPLPAAIVDPHAHVEHLASGFSNASGLTTDDAGHVFFTDAVNHKIYRWNELTKQADVLAEIPGQPMVLGFVRPSTLLAIANERAIFEVSTAGGSPQVVSERALPLANTVLLLPVGLHNQLAVMQDMMERRGYVYRQGSNTAIVSVVQDEHRGWFYAPGTTTAVMAGGTWRPILQSSQLAAFAPGDSHFLTSEDDGRTYRATLSNNTTLMTTVFAERGGTSVVSDNAGHVYVASGHVYVYDRAGRDLGVIEVPERPGSLAFGGPDKRTLFIGARGGLYAIRTRAAGR
jgi:hypothetical protein